MDLWTVQIKKTVSAAQPIAPKLMTGNCAMQNRDAFGIIEIKSVLAINTTMSVHTTMILLGFTPIVRAQIGNKEKQTSKN
jgi:hypothetical protein